jgi:hypothetical protein
MSEKWPSCEARNCYWCTHRHIARERRKHSEYGSRGTVVPKLVQVCKGAGARVLCMRMGDRVWLGLVEGKHGNGNS